MTIETGSSRVGIDTVRTRIGQDGHLLADTLAAGILVGALALRKLPSLDTFHAHCELGNALEGLPSRIPPETIESLKGIREILGTQIRDDDDADKLFGHALMIACFGHEQQHAEVDLEYNPTLNVKKLMDAWNGNDFEALRREAFRPRVQVLVNGILRCVPMGVVVTAYERRTTAHP